MRDKTPKFTDRPILTVSEKLTPEQVERLRERWRESNEICQRQDQMLLQLESVDLYEDEPSNAGEDWLELIALLLCVLSAFLGGIVVGMSL